MMRFISAALLLAALVCSGSAMVQAQTNEKCETKECNFELFVPPVLSLGDCIEDCLCARIRVNTNCQTIVCVDCDDAFIRYERDCDGNILSTFDSIAAGHAVNFFEDKCDLECGGSPLQTKKLDGCWCVASHNGGYWILLTVFPRDCASLCDDCGCYELTCTVKVCTVPVDHCDCPIVLVK